VPSFLITFYRLSNTCWLGTIVHMAPESQAVKAGDDVVGAHAWHGLTEN
jgi:hypothetical protein